MPRSIVAASLASLLALSSCAISEEPAASTATETTRAVTAPKQIESLIGVDCYAKVAEPRTIDTVVVHYASALYWFNEDLQKKVGDEGREYAKSISLTPETLPAHKYDWQLSKAVFQAYKVSAHYIIDREGTIVRLVPENDRAWHAGKSTMPNDGREGVNAFSVGIELMSSHPSDDPTVKTEADAYTEAQYTSLNWLINDIRTRHPITSIVGHDEIAPGRKTDPGPLFRWDRVRDAKFAPLPAK